MAGVQGVNIRKDLMQRLQQKLGRGYVAPYINKLIENELMLSELRERLHPRMKYTAEGNKLEIIDKKKRINADVYIRENSVYCNFDHSTTCEHVLFARTLPELGRLKPRKES